MPIYRFPFKFWGKWVFRVGDMWLASINWFLINSVINLRFVCLLMCASFIDFEVIFYTSIMCNLITIFVDVKWVNSSSFVRLMNVLSTLHECSFYIARFTYILITSKMFTEYVCQNSLTSFCYSSTIKYKQYNIDTLTYPIANIFKVIIVLTAKPAIFCW